MKNNQNEKDFRTLTKLSAVKAIDNALECNEDVEMHTEETQTSIVQHEKEFLGKKIQRSPIENFTHSNNLGAMNCNEIDIENNKFNSDIDMIFKYAENNPFHFISVYAQKFHWPYPIIDTFNIENQEEPGIPFFKTAISVKNNTFRGEGIGPQKRLSKSKIILFLQF